jgi:hypothetical protein
VDALEERIQKSTSAIKSVLETLVATGVDKPKVVEFKEVLRFIEMFESTLCREHAFVAAVSVRILKLLEEAQQDGAKPWFEHLIPSLVLPILETMLLVGGPAQPTPKNELN